MKFKITIINLFIGTIYFLVNTLSISAAETALQIMQKAHLQAYYAGDDGKTQMLMKVFNDEQSQPIKKLFYMLKKDLSEGGEQLFYLFFTKPSDIKRTTFFVHKKIDNDDIRKLYIPASDKVLAIAGSRKQDPFMGSDFSYEDVSGRHYTRDNHKILGQGQIAKRNVYIMESIPKIKEAKIAHIKSWIAKNSYIPLKVEFYNHQGKIFKIYKSGKQKLIQDIPTIMERTMISPLEKTRSIILLNPKKTVYNIGLPRTVFTERSLKNPPMKYLK